MKDFFNYIIFSIFGKLFGGMILTGLLLFLGSYLENDTLYIIGSILAFACLLYVIGIFIVANFFEE